MSTSSTTSALEQHTGYWLRALSNFVHQSFATALSEHGVTVAEWVTLRTLFDRDELLIGELARALGMTGGAVSRLVERLVRKQLVRREDSPHDRRAAIVRLSPAGRRLVPILARCADQNEEAVFGPLEPADRVTLDRLLRELADRHGLRTPPTT